MTPLSIPNLADLQIRYGNLEKTYSTKPLHIFHPKILDLIDSLSQLLLKNYKAKNFSDVISFAFFCRKSNLNSIRSQYRSLDLQIGIGTVFHFTPTNVPINFAYSLIFSLLAGNPNVVRLSSKNYPQYDLILTDLEQLLNSDQFNDLKNIVCFITYSHNIEISEYLLSNCAARMVWGGDRTVGELKKIVVPQKLKDLVFGDRFSISLINSESILELSSKDLDLLSAKFYNDTFLFDQNACSSPKIIFWIGSDSNIGLAQDKFWTKLDRLIQKKFEIAPVNIVEKFTDLCLLAHSNVLGVTRDHNLLYRISIESESLKTLSFTNKLGSIFEVTRNSIQEIDLLDHPKLQTISYFGFNKEELVNTFTSLKPLGVDRIIPIGKALDMTVQWDGYDIIFELTRIIHIE